MNCNLIRSRLFGGTLLAAGVVNGVANAQQIVWEDGLSSNYALEFGDFDPLDADIVPMGGGWIGSFANAYGSANTSGDGIGFSAASTATDLPDAFGISFSYGTFSVTADMILDMSWDLTAPDFGFLSHVRISDTNGVVFDTGNNTSGNAQASLFADTTYSFFAVVGAANEGDGPVNTSFGMFGTPAPSSVALLGIAGLFAARRRR